MPKYCQACRQSLDPNAAVILDSDREVRLCRGCWDCLTIAERVKLTALFADRKDGGLGIRETLDALRHALHEANAHLRN